MTIEAAITVAVKTGKARIQDEFLWVHGMASAPIRNRAMLEPTSKRLELVCPDEIMAAILRALEDSYGLELDDLPRAACRLLGFERVSQDMKDQVLMCAQRLADRKQIKVNGDNVIIVR
jgi:hypothetical protein